MGPCTNNSLVYIYLVRVTKMLCHVSDFDDHFGLASKTVIYGSVKYISYLFETHL